MAKTRSHCIQVGAIRRPSCWKGKALMVLPAPVWGRFDSRIQNLMDIFTVSNTPPATHPPTSLTEHPQEAILETCDL